MDVLVGSNQDEGTFFGGAPASAEAAKTRAKQTYGDLFDDFLKLYPAGTDPEAVASGLMRSRDETGWHQRTWAQLTVKRGKKAYLYYFTHVPPGNAARGATHTGAAVHVQAQSAGEWFLDGARPQGGGHYVVLLGELSPYWRSQRLGVCLTWQPYKRQERRPGPWYARRHGAIWTADRDTAARVLRQVYAVVGNRLSQHAYLRAVSDFLEPVDTRTSQASWWRSALRAPHYVRPEPSRRARQIQHDMPLRSHRTPE